MDLGQFSVSLTVKDIRAAKAFYQTIGFKSLEGCGSIDDKWLIMKSGDAVIGLFEGMFDHNILTFNPKDARAIQQHISAAGYEIEKPCEGDEGPAHFVLVDPDGNQIMFDQH